MKALRTSCNWCWVLPLLLLAAALSGSLLGSRGFDLDEAATLLRTGGHKPVPYNLAEIQQAILDKSPDQAIGWSLLVAAIPGDPPVSPAGAAALYGPGRQRPLQPAHPLRQSLRRRAPASRHAGP